MGRAEELFERLKSEGERAIDQFIATRQVEELFLDFKRSADNGEALNLHQNDRKNLAKAISGFGNSEGGVIVWGVDASRDRDGADVARAKVPITNVTRFLGWLQGAVSGCTLPAHPGVQYHAISAASGNGFVATLVPKSQLSPHQCIGDFRYYMRAGSSFSPVAHSVIAGMMGRRPQPWVFHNFGHHAISRQTLPPTAWGGQLGPGLKVGLSLLLVNKGPGLARDLFSTIKLTAPGPNCQQWFGEPDIEQWIKQRTVTEGMFSIVSKDGFKLPPESIAPSIDLYLVLVPPFSDRLWLHWTYGCEGSPTNLIVLENDAATVEGLYDHFLNEQLDDQGVQQELIRQLFRIPQT